jgi:hypothetical protein
VRRRGAKRRHGSRRDRPHERRAALLCELDLLAGGVALNAGVGRGVWFWRRWKGGRRAGARRRALGDCTFIAETEYENTTEGIACAPENQWSGRTCSVTEKTLEGVSVPAILGAVLPAARRARLGVG